MHISKFLLSSLAALSLASHAAAATFTNEASFLANNTITLTEDFESLSGTFGITGPFNAPSGISVSSQSNQLFAAGPGQSTNPTQAIGSNTPMSDTLTLNLGGPFTAIGFNIFQNLSLGTQSSSNVNYTINAFLSGNLVTSLVRSVSPNGGSYFGFNDVGAFDSVEIANSNAFEVVDDISVGAASTMAPIPLPASLPLLLTGLGGVVALRRRQRG